MQPSAPFVAVPCSEQGKGGPSGGEDRSFISYAFLPQLAPL